MLRWAWKSLISRRLSLWTSVLGIASAFILVMFFDAVFRGESTQIVAYIQQAKPTVWVMQRGVSNMHMASSFIWDWKVDKIARMPEVKKATPILYLNSVVRAGGKDWFSYIVGLEPEATRAGPQYLAAGKAMPGPGEVVIPDIIGKLANTRIGDTVYITDEKMKVVGLSSKTFSMANPVFFVAFSDLDDILSASGTYSYLMVDAKPGVDAQQLADKIMAEVDKVNALTHEDFVNNDFTMALKMGVEIISMMTIIGSALAVLIVGFTSYTQVMSKRRELGIAKAVGIPNRVIYVAVVFQSMCLTALGFALAAAFAFLVMPHIHKALPQITLVVSPGAVAEMGLVALVVAILGALIPAWTVARLDPALVFQN